MKVKAINTITNKAKGITLIALVITVIVLLILVGVTLSLLLGEKKKKKKSVESKATHDREKAMERLNPVLDTTGFLDKDLEKYLPMYKTLLKENKNGG